MTPIVESNTQNMYKVYQAIDRIIAILIDNVDSSGENKLTQNETLRKLGVSEDDIKEYNSHFLAYITATSTFLRGTFQRFNEDTYHKIRNKVLNGELEVE